MGDAISAILRFIRTLVSDLWFASRQRKRLKEMLADPRFPRGFRSTTQLAKGIGADERTTTRLLISMGARKSEVSDEWTLNE